MFFTSLVVNQTQLGPDHGLEYCMIPKSQGHSLSKAFSVHLLGFERSDMNVVCYM